MSRPILIDTLPVYLESLASALAARNSGARADDRTNIAQEHGGERARISSYDIEQLIQEYTLLRSTILEVLEEDAPVPPSSREIILTAIDAGIRDAVTAFALIQAEIRERFVATLTHDLRNPLSAATMAAEIILLDPGNTKEVALLAAEIVGGHKRINRMIQDLLDVTIARSGGRLALRLEKCEMLSVIQRVVTTLTRAHGNRFQVRGERAEGWWSPDALMRAFENLGVNADKYGRSDTPITFSLTTKFERVIIEVHNEGEPIPMEEQEAIFQVFRRRQQGKETKRGWGIGLALVRGVAESHGGSIGIQSDRARGTTFVIDLPIDARPFQTAPTT